MGEIEHSVDKLIRLEQERLRDELHVRFGWVNVSEENFDAVLAPAMQRMFGANGLLKFIADDSNPKKRLWAIKVGEYHSVLDAADGEQLFKDSNSSVYRDPNA